VCCAGGSGCAGGALTPAAPRARATRRAAQAEDASSALVDLFERAATPLGAPRREDAQKRARRPR
jgi:hypothetical protein